MFGCKLILVRLCDSDFGITPVDDITIGITCAALCFHIAHISFSSSWYLFCLSVIVLAILCVFGTAMSIKKVFYVFLFIKVMSVKRYCFFPYVCCDSSTAWNFNSPVNWLVCTYNMGFYPPSIQLLLPVSDGLLLLLLLLFDMIIPCHRSSLPGTSLEPAFIPTAQASSSTLQYFPYYVWCSKYSCLL